MSASATQGGHNEVTAVRRLYIYISLVHRSIHLFNSDKSSIQQSRTCSLHTHWQL